MSYQDRANDAARASANDAEQRKQDNLKRVRDALQALYDADLDSFVLDKLEELNDIDFYQGCGSVSSDGESVDENNGIWRASIAADYDVPDGSTVTQTGVEHHEGRWVDEVFGGRSPNAGHSTGRKEYRPPYDEPVFMEAMKFTSRTVSTSVAFKYEREANQYTVSLFQTDPADSHAYSPGELLAFSREDLDSDDGIEEVKDAIDQGLVDHTGRLSGKWSVPDRRNSAIETRRLNSKPNRYYPR